MARAITISSRSRFFVQEADRVVAKKERKQFVPYAKAPLVFIAQVWDKVYTWNGSQVRTRYGGEGDGGESLKNRGNQERVK